MATGYTNLLGLALPVTGELSDSWGDVVNNSVTQLAEDSIAGTAFGDVTSADWVLDDTGGGSTNESRCAILVVGGTPAASMNVVAPERSKAYVVINKTDQTLLFKGASTTGTDLSPGVGTIVAWDGADFVSVGRESVYVVGNGFDLFGVDRNGRYIWVNGDMPTNAPTSDTAFADVVYLDASTIRIDVYSVEGSASYSTVYDGADWLPWTSEIRSDEYATLNEAKTGVVGNKIISPLTLAGVFVDKSQTSVTDDTAGALMKVGAFGLGVPIELDDSTDLDTVLVPGLYSQKVSGDATVVNHYPVVKAGSLLVTAHIGVTQTYAAADGSGVYVRGYNGAVWSPWSGLGMPVGSTYMQFPGQIEPAQLWGGSWSKLFSTEGVFFRTEGGQAGPFNGSIQDSAFGAHNHGASATIGANGSHTHTIGSNGSHTHSYSLGRANPNPGGGSIIGGGLDLDRRSGSGGIGSGGDHTHSITSAGSHTHSVSVATTNTGSNETRPRNITVRIWLRTA